MSDSDAQESSVITKTTLTTGSPLRPSERSTNFLGMESASTLPDCSDAVYTSCYCEENIYWLVKRFLILLGEQPQWDIFSVFISNPTRTVTDMNFEEFIGQDSEVYHTGGIVESAGGIIW